MTKFDNTLFAWKWRIVGALIGLIMATPMFIMAAKADDITVEMLNKLGKEKMVYSESISRIDVGDTITWLPKSKGHNVQFIAGPDGWDIPKKSKNNAEVAITFDVPGVYLYQCTPHATMGMIALVVVGDDTSNIDAIKKMKMRGKSKKKFKKLLKEI
tara:strand:+ start:820 stop:1290 length:471 start_codon:yes stop_codon:yes gene_type:complete